jgi:hypothetical protein
MLQQMPIWVKGGLAYMKACLLKGQHLGRQVCFAL